MTARKAIQYVEIELPVCLQVYGVAPCTAAEGVTGAAKCFNTLSTCQDVANYDATTVTLRLVEDVGYRAIDIEALPILSEVSFNPATLRPGQDLGDRATLSVVLRDTRHADTGPGFDPYQGERGYDPYPLGTLLGRFRARQPYLRGAEIRWYVGFADQALSEMECRTFVVEATDGPGVDGRFAINATDPLRALGGDRSQSPDLTPGKLTADISDTDTAATLSPAGIGNSTYPASGYVALGGSEIAAFTRSADTLTLTRGQLGTVAEAHKAQDRVQLVLRYAAADPADIIHDLMVNHAGIPSGYIPLAEWQAETAAYLRRNYTATIGEPMPVAQLVGELMVEAGLSIWWDDIPAKIRLRVVRALPQDAQRFDETTIIPGTFTRAEQPQARISQVRVFYGRKDPLKNSDQSDNYAQVLVVADLDNEANYGSAAIREIWSRWITAGGSSAAQRVGDLLIGRFRYPPRKFTESFMRGVILPAPQLGNLYVQGYRTEQNADGTPEDVPVQVTRVVALKDRHEVECVEMRYDSLDDDDLTNRTITIDYDTRDLNLRTLHDSLFPAPVSGDVVTLIIAENVVIGSTSTATAALTIGSWPSGVSITVQNNGRLQGHGGDGGTGANGAGDVDATDGQPGGPALYTRYAITLIDEDGELWGGGGGGGGGGCRNPNDHKGGGGGGGAGDEGGAGGVGPDKGGEGAAGTREAGGAGGYGWTNNSFFSGPKADAIRRGGNGGGPGLAGQAGQANSDLDDGAGGAPGAAIDGVSYVTTSGSAGDRRGGQIN